MTRSPDLVHLTAGDARATLALRGAEPVAWAVGGRDLLWSGDPAHWAWHAPLLFPVIGESAGRVVRVGGRTYPMGRHGFARESRFTLLEAGADRTRLRLEASEATRAHYPFAFRLDVTATLGPTELRLDAAVENTGEVDLPYALGAHPAFHWPFAGGDPQAYRVAFEAEEDAGIPDITQEGLLREGGRRLPLQGRTLPLDPGLFAADALVLRNLRSRSLAFTAPSGEAVALAWEGFRHVALWTKPTAPFLSLETWTGHADPEGFAGELAEKPSIERLPPGAIGRHALTFAWREAGAA